MKFPAITSDRLTRIGLMTIALCGSLLWQSRPVQAVTLDYETQIFGTATADESLAGLFANVIEGIPIGALPTYNGVVNSGQIVVPDRFADQVDTGALQIGFLQLSRFLNLPSQVEQQADTWLDRVKIDFVGTGNLRSAQGETPFSFRYHNPGDMDVAQAKWKTMTVDGYAPEVVKSCLMMDCQVETAATPWSVAYLAPSQAKLAGFAAPVLVQPVTLLSGNFQYVVNTSPQEQIPTPALLPGLVGVTASLWRRKRANQDLPV
jgi:hypothetical protein